MTYGFLAVLAKRTNDARGNSQIFILITLMSLYHVNTKVSASRWFLHVFNHFSLCFNHTGVSIELGRSWTLVHLKHARVISDNWC